MTSRPQSNPKRTATPRTNASNEPPGKTALAKGVAVYARSAVRKPPESLRVEVQPCIDFSRNAYGTEPVMFADNGLSGVTLVRRGLYALLEAAKAGEIDVVLVSDADRISRNALQGISFLDRLEQNGAELRCVTGDGTSEKMDASSWLPKPLMSAKPSPTGRTRRG
jgi:Resolvase, N terminal domain